MGLISSLKKMCNKFQTDGLTLSEKAVYKFIKEIDSGIYDDMFWCDGDNEADEWEFHNNEHLFGELIIREKRNSYKNDYIIISKIILDDCVRDYLKKRLYESVTRAVERSIIQSKKEFEEEHSNELEEYLYENNK